MAEATLEYLITTSPSPLTVNSESGPSSDKSRVNVMVTNHSDAVVNCTQLVFRFKEGSGSGDLTENLKGVKYSPVDTGSWQMRRAEDGNSYKYLAVPNNAQSVTIGKNKSFLFEFSGITVNTKIGVTLLSVEEWTTKSSTDPTGTKSVEIAKYPVGFKFGDFHAVDPKSGKVISRVDHNGKVNLVWSGTEGATYSLSWNDQTPIDVTHQREYPVSGQSEIQLTNDTTFVLSAAFTDEGSRQSVKHFHTTTVGVSRPDVSAYNLTAFNVNVFSEGGMIVGVGGAGIVTTHYWKYDGAPTDGFVLGRIAIGTGVPLGEYINLFCGIDGYYQPFGVTIPGTYSGSMTPKGTTYDSFVAPIPKGVKFTVAIRFSQSFWNDASMVFAWCPLGQNGTFPVRGQEGQSDIKWNSDRNTWDPA
jgi:hypothetical protein